MYSPLIVAEALLNGLMLGAVYALIALGLTLIYGVLHIVNFAHGALLTVAMFGVWLLAAPLVFWTPDAAVYANDTLIGALVLVRPSPGTGRG